jgi:tetratricopeptide (TPR) repeat protein
MSTAVRKNKKLSKKHTARANQLIQQAVTNYQSGQLQSAEQLCLSILTQYPQHTDAFHLLGVIAHVSGNVSGAISYFEQTVQLNPHHADAHNNLATTLILCNRINEAISHLNKAISINPRLIDARYNLANAYFRLNQYDHAIINYKHVIADNPNHAEAYNNLGNVFQILNRDEEAFEYLQTAVELNPNFFEAFNNLGNYYKKNEQIDNAIKSYSQSIILNPQCTDAHFNLGIMLQDVERFEEAISCYKQVIGLKKDHVEAHYKLGFIYQRFAEYNEARFHFEEAIKFKEDYKEAKNDLAYVLYNLGEVNDAIQMFEDLILTHPDYFSPYSNLANIFFHLGKTDESIEKYKQALAVDPGHAETYRHLSAIKPDPEQVDNIKKRLQEADISALDKMHYHYALGAIYNHIKSYDESFHHYSIANQLKRESFEYDARKHTEYVNRVINTFSISYFQSKPVIGSNSERPVFIVGMPRSGTTLIEQIISSHSDIAGADELILMPKIENLLDKEFSNTSTYPECMNDVDETILGKYAEEYLVQLTKISKEALRVSDKLPDNFLRIGLIKQLFPNAKIIHCKRNALDTCSSIYLNYFPKGNHHTFDLHDLGNYYLDYLRIMKHWNTVFSSELFEIQYEDLISDQEKMSRQLIEYIGLKWDDKCINFYNNDRAVKTTSNLQVRQPVYNKSINRWKRYEKELQSLIDILEQ